MSMIFCAHEDIEDGGGEVGHEIDEHDVGMMHDDDGFYDDDGFL